MMNENHLKEAWEKIASDDEKSTFQLPKLRVNMDREINKFEIRINKRDRREIITAAGLLVFTISLSIIGDGHQRTGAILLSGYLVWIIFYLTKTKMQQPSFSISKSIKEQLVEYKSYVLLQQRLVRNALYWYILPIIPGMIFFSLSMDSKFGIAAILSINSLILFYVYRLNQRAAKENYTVLLRELNQAIQSLGT